MTETGIDTLAIALVDRYLVGEELGRGASATVYRARDLRHDRWVALKVLHSTLGSALGVERFQREIRTQARLHHPHLLPLFDSGVAAGQLYYTMPYVATGSLRTRLSTTPEGLPVERVVEWAKEVASALSYAHAQGIVHRDLKPENILLTDTGNALVSDFGIAYSLDERSHDDRSGRLTESGLTLGTPAYMSPEQSAGDEPVDHRSDVYSLAAVVYEALSGKPPITGPNARSIIARRLTELPSSILTLRPDVPAHIDRALTRALARHAEDRFESTADFARALEVADEGVVTAAAPARFRFTGRQSLAVLGLLLLAVLAGTGYWYARQHPSAAAGKSRQEMRVLVVLPLKNLGPAADQYFADGLTEELTSRLAGLSGLRVISRTSADQYRDSRKSLRTIGEELGAGYVLEGSVRWERNPTGAPGRIRVTPQLIAVNDDSHLWSQVYDAELTEAFGVQSQIAEQVTAALDVTLLAPERAALARVGTRSAQAYDLYLRGLEYLGRSNQGPDLLAAADFFTRSVAADPQFAQGQARLARAHVQVYWHYYDHTETRLGLARKALDAAIVLAPDLAETHIARGYYHYWGEMDYDGALAEFEAALRRQPSNAELLQAIGYVERRQGRWEESTAHFVEGLRYDPRSGMRNFEIGDNYSSMHRYAEAEHYLDRAITLSPDWPNPYVYKAWMYVSWHGDVARARAILGQSLHRLDVNRFAASMSAGDRISASLITADSTFWPLIDGLSLAKFTGDPPRYHTLKAELARFRGDRRVEYIHGDSTRLMIEQRMRGPGEEPRMLPVLALGLAHIGRYDEAIRAAERAIEVIPLSRDAVSGPYFYTTLAMVYMYAGKLDRASEVLEGLLEVPCWITPAELRSDPIWTPLRSHPRFRKLTQE